eukprot:CAMPEP_0180521170 /NCGR_PEP_ID=MMETSP1036_2-20121128/56671_1 /TAXON_ID=632150 /ORGANISM="Azadinium spinosum, Strain 3D9" /LENGTH=50 /DNA_ID=CAMNT_0022533743 /DNA_START=91 /DNA_END=239 /DNA_ORIENTATION=-
MALACMMHKAADATWTSLDVNVTIFKMKALASAKTIWVRYPSSAVVLSRG